MRLSRIVLGATLLWMTTSMPLIADEQEATVRDQVQQERTQSFDRLSRLRQRMDKIQLQLEQLDIENIVKQRMQAGTKPSVADETFELAASLVPSERPLDRESLIDPLVKDQPTSS